jgi:hypothetical protein
MKPGSYAQCENVAYMADAFFDAFEDAQKSGASVDEATERGMAAFEIEHEVRTGKKLPKRECK